MKLTAWKIVSVPEEIKKYMFLDWFNYIFVKMFLEGNAIFLMSTSFDFQYFVHSKTLNILHNDHNVD